MGDVSWTQIDLLCRWIGCAIRAAFVFGAAAWIEQIETKVSGMREKTRMWLTRRNQNWRFPVNRVDELRIANSILLKLVLAMFTTKRPESDAAVDSFENEIGAIGCDVLRGVLRRRLATIVPFGCLKLGENGGDRIGLWDGRPISWDHRAFMSQRRRPRGRDLIRQLVARQLFLKNGCGSASQRQRQRRPAATHRQKTASTASTRRRPTGSVLLASRTANGRAKATALCWALHFHSISVE